MRFVLLFYNGYLATKIRKVVETSKYEFDFLAYLLIFVYFRIGQDY